MIKITLIICVVMKVFQTQALVQLRTSLASSDNPLLAKILQSIDAATSDEHLFEVTLKLLKSLCVCMRDTLKAKEDTYNSAKNLIGFSKTVSTEGKVLDLYKKIYNNTCFNLKHDLSKRSNASSESLSHSNCGKEDRLKANNFPKNEEDSQTVKNVLRSKLEHILYRALVQTRHHHKYNIKKYNLFGKAKSRVKSSLKHTLIVILTLHPARKDLRKYNVVEEDLHKVLHTNSTIDIDIIDTKYDQKGKESEEAVKPEVYSECHLQSLYTYLAESEKKNLTKVFRFLRRRDTIKIYIEVFTGRNHSDYINICCTNGSKPALCKKELIEYIDSQENITVQYKTLDKGKSLALKNNLKNTISKLKQLVKRLDFKTFNNSSIDLNMRNVDISSNITSTNETKNGLLAMKENNSVTLQLGLKPNGLPNFAENLTHPLKLQDVSRAIILLNDFVSKQTTTDDIKSPDHKQIDLINTLSLTEVPFLGLSPKTTSNLALLEETATISGNEIETSRDTIKMTTVKEQDGIKFNKNVALKLNTTELPSLNFKIKADNNSFIMPHNQVTTKNSAPNVVLTNLDNNLITSDINNKVVPINELQNKQQSFRTLKDIFPEPSTISYDVNLSNIRYTKQFSSGSNRHDGQHISKNGNSIFSKNQVKLIRENEKDTTTFKYEEKNSPAIDHKSKHTSLLKLKIRKDTVKPFTFSISKHPENVSNGNFPRVQQGSKQDTSTTQHKDRNSNKPDKQYYLKQSTKSVNNAKTFQKHIVTLQVAMKTFNNSGSLANSFGPKTTASKFSNILYPHSKTTRIDKLRPYQKQKLQNQNAINYSNALTKDDKQNNILVSNRSSFTSTTKSLKTFLIVDNVFKIKAANMFTENRISSTEIPITHLSKEEQMKLPTKVYTSLIGIDQKLPLKNNNSNVNTDSLTTPHLVAVVNSSSYKHLPTHTWLSMTTNKTYNLKALNATSRDTVNSFDDHKKVSKELLDPILSNTILEIKNAVTLINKQPEVSNKTTRKINDIFENTIDESNPAADSLVSDSIFSNGIRGEPVTVVSFKSTMPFIKPAGVATKPISSDENKYYENENFGGKNASILNDTAFTNDHTSVVKIKYSKIKTIVTSKKRNPQSVTIVPHYDKTKTLTESSSFLSRDKNTVLNISKMVNNGDVDIKTTSSATTPHSNPVYDRNRILIGKSSSQKTSSKTHETEFSTNNSTLLQITKPGLQYIYTHVENSITVPSTKASTAHTDDDKMITNKQKLKETLTTSTNELINVTNASIPKTYTINYGERDPIENTINFIKIFDDQIEVNTLNDKNTYKTKNIERKTKAAILTRTTEDQNYSTGLNDETERDKSSIYNFENIADEKVSGNLGILSINKDHNKMTTEPIKYTLRNTKNLIYHEPVMLTEATLFSTNPITHKYNQFSTQLDKIENISESKNRIKDIVKASNVLQKHNIETSSNFEKYSLFNTKAAISAELYDEMGNSVFDTTAKELYDLEKIGNIEFNPISVESDETDILTKPLFSKNDENSIPYTTIHPVIPQYNYINTFESEGKNTVSEIKKIRLKEPYEVKLTENVVSQTSTEITNKTIENNTNKSKLTILPSKSTFPLQNIALIPMSTSNAKTNINDTISMVNDIINTDTISSTMGSTTKSYESNTINIDSVTQGNNMSTNPTGTGNTVPLEKPHKFIETENTELNNIPDAIYDEIFATNSDDTTLGNSKNIVSRTEIADSTIIPTFPQQKTKILTNNTSKYNSKNTKDIMFTESYNAISDTRNFNIINTTQNITNNSVNDVSTMRYIDHVDKISSNRNMTPQTFGVFAKNKSFKTPYKFLEHTNAKSLHTKSNKTLAKIYYQMFDDSMKSKKYYTRATWNTTKNLKNDVNNITDLVLVKKGTEISINSTAIGHNTTQTLENITSNTFKRPYDKMKSNENTEFDYTSDPINNEQKTKKATKSIENISKTTKSIINPHVNVETTPYSSNTLKYSPTKIKNTYKVTLDPSNINVPSTKRNVTKKYESLINSTITKDGETEKKNKSQQTNKTRYKDVQKIKAFLKYTSASSKKLTHVQPYSISDNVNTIFENKSDGLNSKNKESTTKPIGSVVNRGRVTINSIFLQSNVKKTSFKHNSNTIENKLFTDSYNAIFEPKNDYMSTTKKYTNGEINTESIVSDTTMKETSIKSTKTQYDSTHNFESIVTNTSPKTISATDAYIFYNTPDLNVAKLNKSRNKISDFTTQNKVFFTNLNYTKKHVLIENRGKIEDLSKDPIFPKRNTKSISYSREITINLKNIRNKTLPVSDNITLNPKTTNVYNATRTIIKTYDTEIENTSMKTIKIQNISTRKHESDTKHILPITRSSKVDTTKPQNDETREFESTIKYTPPLTRSTPDEHGFHTLNPIHNKIFLPNYHYVKDTEKNTNSIKIRDLTTDPMLPPRNIKTTSNSIFKYNLKNIQEKTITQAYHAISESKNDNNSIKDQNTNDKYGDSVINKENIETKMKNKTIDRQNNETQKYEHVIKYTSPMTRSTTYSYVFHNSPDRIHKKVLGETLDVTKSKNKINHLTTNPLLKINLTPTTYNTLNYRPCNTKGKMFPELNKYVTEHTNVKVSGTMERTPKNYRYDDNSIEAIDNNLYNITVALSNTTKTQTNAFKSGENIIKHNLEIVSNTTFKKLDSFLATINTKLYNRTKPMNNVLFSTKSKNIKVLSNVTKNIASRNNITVLTTNPIFLQKNVEATVNGTVKYNPQNMKDIIFTESYNAYVTNRVVSMLKNTGNRFNKKKIILKLSNIEETNNTFKTRNTVPKLKDQIPATKYNVTNSDVHDITKAKTEKTQNFITKSMLTQKNQKDISESTDTYVPTVNKETLFRRPYHLDETTSTVFETALITTNNEKFGSNLSITKTNESIDRTIDSNNVTLHNNVPKMFDTVQYLKTSIQDPTIPELNNFEDNENKIFNTTLELNDEASFSKLNKTKMYDNNAKVTKIHDTKLNLIAVHKKNYTPRSILKYRTKTGSREFIAHNMNTTMENVNKNKQSKISDMRTKNPNENALDISKIQNINTNQTDTHDKIVIALQSTTASTVISTIFEKPITDTENVLKPHNIKNIIDLNKIKDQQIKPTASLDSTIKFAQPNTKFIFFKNSYNKTDNSKIKAIITGQPFIKLNFVNAINDTLTSTINALSEDSSNFRVTEAVFGNILRPIIYEKTSAKPNITKHSFNFFTDDSENQIKASNITNSIFLQNITTTTASTTRYTEFMVNETLLRGTKSNSYKIKDQQIKSVAILDSTIKLAQPNTKFKIFQNSYNEKDNSEIKSKIKAISPGHYTKLNFVNAIDGTLTSKLNAYSEDSSNFHVTKTVFGNIPRPINYEITSAKPSITNLSLNYFTGNSENPIKTSNITNSIFVQNITTTTASTARHTQFILNEILLRDTESTIYTIKPEVIKNKTNKIKNIFNTNLTTKRHKPNLKNIASKSNISWKSETTKKPRAVSYILKPLTKAMSMKYFTSKPHTPVNTTLKIENKINKVITTKNKKSAYLKTIRPFYVTDSILPVLQTSRATDLLKIYTSGQQEQVIQRTKTSKPNNSNTEHNTTLENCKRNSEELQMSENNTQKVMLSKGTPNFFLQTFSKTLDMKTDVTLKVDLHPVSSNSTSHILKDIGTLELSNVHGMDTKKLVAATPYTVSVTKQSYNEILRPILGKKTTSSETRNYTDKNISINEFLYTKPIQKHNVLNKFFSDYVTQSKLMSASDTIFTTKEPSSVISSNLKSETTKTFAKPTNIPVFKVGNLNPVIFPTINNTIHAKSGNLKTIKPDEIELSIRVGIETTKNGIQFSLVGIDEKPTKMSSRIDPKSTKKTPSKVFGLPLITNEVKPNNLSVEHHNGNINNKILTAMNLNRRANKRNDIAETITLSNNFKQVNPPETKNSLEKKTVTVIINTANRTVSKNRANYTSASAINAVNKKIAVHSTVSGTEQISEIMNISSTVQPIWRQHKKIVIKPSSLTDDVTRETLKQLYVKHLQKLKTVTNEMKMTTQMNGPYKNVVSDEPAGTRKNSTVIENEEEDSDSLFRESADSEDDNSMFVPHHVSKTKTKSFNNVTKDKNVTHSTTHMLRSHDNLTNGYQYLTGINTSTFYQHKENKAVPTIVIKDVNLHNNSKVTVEDHDETKYHSGTTAYSAEIENKFQNETTHITPNQNKVGNKGDETIVKILNISVGKTSAKEIKRNKSHIRKRKKLINALKYKNDIAGLLKKLVRTKKIDIKELNSTNKNNVIHSLLSKIRKPTIHINKSYMQNKSTDVPIETNYKSISDGKLQEGYKTQIDKPTRKSFFSNANDTAIKLSNPRLIPTDIITRMEKETKMSLNRTFAMTSTIHITEVTKKPDQRTFNSNSFFGIKPDEISGVLNYTERHKFFNESLDNNLQKVSVATFNHIQVKDKIGKPDTSIPIVLNILHSNSTNTLSLINTKMKGMERSTEFTKNNPILDNDSKENLQLTTLTTNNIKSPTKTHYITIKISIPYLTLHETTKKTSNNHVSKTKMNNNEYTSELRNVTAMFNMRSKDSKDPLTPAVLMANATKLNLSSTVEPKTFRDSSGITHSLKMFSDFASKDRKTNTEHVHHKSPTIYKAVTSIAELKLSDLDVRRNVNEQNKSVAKSSKHVLNDTNSNISNESMIKHDIDNKFTKVYSAISNANNLSITPNTVLLNLNNITVPTSNIEHVSKNLTILNITKPVKKHFFKYVPNKIIPGNNSELPQIKKIYKIVPEKTLENTILFRIKAENYTENLDAAIIPATVTNVLNFEENNLNLVSNPTLEIRTRAYLLNKTSSNKQDLHSIHKLNFTTPSILTTVLKEIQDDPQNSTKKYLSSSTSSENKLKLTATTNNPITYNINSYIYTNPLITTFRFGTTDNSNLNNATTKRTSYKRKENNLTFKIISLNGTPNVHSTIGINLNKTTSLTENPYITRHEKLSSFESTYKDASNFPQYIKEKIMIKSLFTENTTSIINQVNIKTNYKEDTQNSNKIQVDAITTTEKLDSIQTPSAQTETMPSLLKIQNATKIQIGDKKTETTTSFVKIPFNHLVGEETVNSEKSNFKDLQKTTQTVSTRTKDENNHTSHFISVPLNTVSINHIISKIYILDPKTSKSIWNRYTKGNKRQNRKTTKIYQKSNKIGESFTDKTPLTRSNSIEKLSKNTENIQHKHTVTMASHKSEMNISDYKEVQNNKTLLTEMIKSNLKSYLSKITVPLLLNISIHGKQLLNQFKMPHSPNEIKGQNTKTTKIYQKSNKISESFKNKTPLNRSNSIEKISKNPKDMTVTMASHKSEMNISNNKEVQNNKTLLTEMTKSNLKSYLSKITVPLLLNNSIRQKQLLNQFKMPHLPNKINNNLKNTFNLNTTRNSSKSKISGPTDYLTIKFKDKNTKYTSRDDRSLPTLHKSTTETHLISTRKVNYNPLSTIFAESGSIEGKNVKIYSSRLHRYHFLRPPLTVTNHIKYNTYQPPTEEDIESSTFKPRLSPRPKVSCAILKTMRHKFHSTYEFIEFLKASNCSADNLTIHLNIKNNRFLKPPLKQNPSRKVNNIKHPIKKLIKRVFTKLGSKESLLNSFEKTKLYPVKPAKAVIPKLPPNAVKRIKIGGTKKKEVISMNTRDFFSQHRLATPIHSKKQNVKVRQKNPLLVNTRFSIVRPKFNPFEIPQKPLDRPKAFFLSPRNEEETFAEIYEAPLHHKKLNWKQRIGSVRAALRNNPAALFPSQIKAPVSNVLDKPHKHPKTDWDIFRDKTDLSNKKLWGPPDFVPVTWPPVFDLSLPKPLTPTADEYNLRQLQYRRNFQIVTSTLKDELLKPVTDWWLDDMYLKVRLPLPINSNPGMVFPRRHFAKMEEVADLGALFIDDILDYKEMLDRGELPLERATSREKGQPLCMEQFYRLLGVCRIPEVGKDRLELPAVKSGTEEQEELVVVACRNYFYPIPVKAADRGRITPGEIQAQLLHAMVDAAGAPPAPRIGLLTSMNRDQWAKAREHLVKDEMNRMNLELISRALCILCLDEAGGDRADTDPETNAMLRAMHGAGTRHHSANRWFDKTVQLIISSDGTVGMCYEHSAAEGVAVVRLAERALARAEVADRPAPPPALLPAPQAMKWNIVPEVQRTIEHAARELDRAISDLDFKVYTYRGYGREFMKSCRTSPDVYIQLAIQYAYYKMYGYLVTTYESASLRRFRQGRVDNIRSAHGAALAWAAAMCTAEASPLNDGTDEGQKKVSFNLYGEQKKLELFEEAARKQTSIMEANILGKGIDNHLLGLREMARETMGELPPVFCDTAYKQMFEFKMSTSQVTTTTDGTFMGYGAVCPDGYGCCYNPKKDSIIFCISSFTSSSVTNTEAYRQSLEEALDSMKLMFQARKTEN